MGIKVMIHWVVRLPVAQADTALRAGLKQMGASPSGPLGHIKGRTKASWSKNRNPARITVEIREHSTGAGAKVTVAKVTVDAAGTKHQEMLNELSATLGVGVVERVGSAAKIPARPPAKAPDRIPVIALDRSSARPAGRSPANARVSPPARADAAAVAGEEAGEDRGITEALEKLSGFSRMLARREISHLRTVLHPEERVLALGQGSYENLQSLIVLTDTRLVFLEKGLLRESVKEFQLGAISSLSLSKGWGTESLEFTVSGARGKITQLESGQGENIANLYRQLRNTPVAKPPAPAPAAPDQPDVLAQLARLGQLRDAGVLTEEEFTAKKRELLGRL